MSVFINQHRAAGFADGLGHVAHNYVPPFVSRDFIGRAKAVQIIIKKSVGAFDKLAERLAAVGLDETIRVVRLRHHRHTHGDSRREQMVERTHGGVLPGLVRIKTQNDFVNVALDDARVLVGEGRALRRDDVLHAGHEARDQVQLAFADDGGLRVEQRAL